MIASTRFVLLGTGTSAGIPVIGCDCATCTSADPRDRRTRSGAMLQFVDGDGCARTILLDCPPDHREQSLREKITRCDAILFTHDHVDHTFGLDEVRRYNALMATPIEIFADARTRESIERVFRHIFKRHENVNDSFVADLMPRTIELGRPIDLFGVRFTPFRLLHGGLPILGFRIEAIDGSGAVAAEQPGPLPLAYCTDVNGIPPDSWTHLRGLKTLVLDMLRYRRHPTHFSFDEALGVAAEVGAAQTLFVHMTHDILHAECEARLPDGVRLGFDGLSLD